MADSNICFYLVAQQGHSTLKDSNSDFYSSSILKFCAILKGLTICIYTTKFLPFSKTETLGCDSEVSASKNSRTERPEVANISFLLPLYWVLRSYVIENVENSKHVYAFVVHLLKFMFTKELAKYVCRIYGMKV